MHVLVYQTELIAKQGPSSDNVIKRIAAPSLEVAQRFIDSKVEWKGCSKAQAVIDAPAYHDHETCQMVEDGVDVILSENDFVLGARTINHFQHCGETWSDVFDGAHYQDACEKCGAIIDPCRSDSDAKTPGYNDIFQ